MYDYENMADACAGDGPLRIECLFQSLDGIFQYLVPVGVLLAIIFAIVGGYMWMTSAGDPDRAKQAQGTLTWSIIGLVFILIVGLLLRTLVDYLAGL